MRGIILLATGAAIGYVIGARRGRPAYDRLKQQASDVLENPRVQRGVASAQHFIEENVPVVGEQLADAIGDATGVTGTASSTANPRKRSTGGSSARPSS